MSSLIFGISLIRQSDDRVYHLDSAVYIPGIKVFWGALEGLSDIQS
jgi:hypothetical protein